MVTRTTPVGLSLVCALLAAPTLGCRKNGDALPQHYDDPRAMIATFEAKSRDEWQMPDRVVRALPINSANAVIADIGAGSGYFTRRLAIEVPEGKVYAVDVDREFEEYLLENREGWGTPNIEPHLAHYEDPMLPTGEIDLVFTANTYSYIRDRTVYFRKVLDVLKADARLVVIDYRKDAEVPGGAAPDPKHRVPRDVAAQELQAAGFAIEREESFLPHQYFLILKAAQ